MTRRQLRVAVSIVIFIYALFGIIAFVLRVLETVIEPQILQGYRDAAPFLFAIPAALLGYAFQQRFSYLASLRTLWSRLVVAVNGAIQYTYDETPTAKEHAKVMAELGIAIDEVRGVYRNVGEQPGAVGLYPYEPIKDIYRLINELGYDVNDPTRRKVTREQIITKWQSIRFAFLSEFDRAEPSQPITEQKST
jgi:hypothetical protein